MRRSGPVFPLVSAPATPSKKAAPAAGRPLISVCLIVRDERKNLGACLDSLRDWPGEIIVVDTGSADGTPEYARQRGARVIEAAWDNDFSQARNLALAAARGAWILILDADEYLRAPDRAALVALAQAGAAAAGGPGTAYTLQQKSSTDGGRTGMLARQVRLFPNRADIRFDDAKLKLVAGAGGGIPASESGIAIDLSGNVGIGTTSPTKKLQVQGTVVTETAVKSTGERAILSLESNVGGQNRVWTLESGLFGTPGLFGIYDRTAVAARLAITPDGNVGIGTATPQAKLDVAGATRTCVLTITGGCDLAEPFPMGVSEAPKGSVVVIDDEHPGQLKASDRAYDTRVAGIVSGANGVNPGISLQQEGVLEGGQNVALSGRVYVLADAAQGAIRPGDLLTTSDTPGHAMKVGDLTRAQGAILGKAMSSLKEGKGLVLVLVTLQ